MNRLLLALSLAALLGACGGTRALKDTGPAIKTLGSQKAPTQEDLPIVLSDPVEVNPQRALDNYKAIMELAPDPQTRAEAMRRMADLQVEIRDLTLTADADELLDGSIDLYKQLLKENPNDPKNDRVLYQLARAYQNSGQEQKAVETLARLSKEFPESRNAGDGRYRRGELLFKMREYAEAAVEYKAVLELGDATPFFENAQYMYGWSLYKQSRYDDALDSFFQILERELPPGQLVETEIALAQVADAKRDIIADVLRVTNLALASLGGGVALNETMARTGEPRYYVLLYNSLGASLLATQRYTDAANTYAAFTKRYSSHPLAPQFQLQVIQAYNDAGFSDQVVEEKERYAVTYDPDADYWAQGVPSQAVLTELRAQLEDLASYYHARAPESATRTEDFLTAGKWYKRLLEVYPRDPEAPDLNFRYADALLDGGEIAEAAAQYTRTAYDYTNHPRNAEAAYAAVLAYQKMADASAPDTRKASLRTAIDAGIRYANRFKDHEQVNVVLTRSAEDLYLIEAYDEAIQVARRVAQAVTPADPALQRTVWGVIADAEFTQQRYEEAENAYGQLLLRVPEIDEQHREVQERLSASVYKQGEAARSVGDLRGAVYHFLRLGALVPTASARPNAEYDAAAALIELEDWNEAARVLEGFRGKFRSHPLVPDADKRLAATYEKAERPADAAGAYTRIAKRRSEDLGTRRSAALRAGQLYDEAQQAPQATQAWEYYVENFPDPLDPAMDARERLLELAMARNDEVSYRLWLRRILEADQAAGPLRTDRSRSLGAESALKLGKIEAAEAAAINITLPIESSLPAKRAALEQAIRRLDLAAAYGYAEITTAATYELGQLYRDFAGDLIQSQRPRGLDALELEQYELLLEEQAYPFEEQAIGYHETNLRRILNGTYDEWVQSSYGALAAMVPGTYSKTEQQERFHDQLQ